MTKNKEVLEIPTPRSIKLIASNLMVKPNLKQFKRLAYSTHTTVTMTEPDAHFVVHYVLELEVVIVLLSNSKKSETPTRHQIAGINASFEAKFKVEPNWEESLELARGYTQSVFPFVQEYVSDVTHRMGFPTLLLPHESIVDLSRANQTSE